MPRLMEVIEYLDESGHAMVKRIPDNGICEVKWGAQLTVRESQVAVFFRDGRALDVFNPGRYVLKTQNLPLISKWVTRFGYGPDSPFRSEVYFIGTKLFPNLKWGTSEPILFKDSELHMIRLRSFGIFSIQIEDPLIFLNKMSGTRALYTDFQIEEYLKKLILSTFIDVLGNEVDTVFNLPQNYEEISIIVKSKLLDEFEALGLKLHDFYINAISIPEEVQEMIDTRAGMAAIGDLDQFFKYKTALAMQSAAENPGGGASAGVGIGAGLGMGYMLPQMMMNTSFGNISNSPKEKGNDSNNYAKLKQLKELLDLGAISQSEFDEKKGRLLENLW